MKRVLALVGLVCAVAAVGCLERRYTPRSLKVTAAAVDAEIAFGRSASLTSASEGGTAPYLYRWSLERSPTDFDGSAEVLPSPTSQNPTTAALDADGEYMFRVQITDSVGDHATDYVTITVRASTPSDVFEVVIDGPEMVEAGESATLSAETDFDGELSFAWEVIDGEAEIVSPAAAVTEVVAESVGVVTIRVTMTNNEGGATTTDEFDLNVGVAPSLTVSIAGDVDVVTNESTVLTATAGGGGSGVTFSWRIVSGPGALTSPSGGMITFTASEEGSSVVEVRATDPASSAQATDRVTLTIVEGTPVEPFMITTSPPALVEPGGTATVTASTTSTAEVIEYSWVVVDGAGNIASENSATTEVTVGASATTVLQVTVTASNPGGSSRAQATTAYLVVLPEPDPIVVFDIEDFGTVRVRLDSEATPITVANFLSYIDEGFFNGIVIHRVETGQFGVIQGGGFLPSAAPDYNSSDLQPTHAQIVNEAANAGSNIRGTIAMARTNNPNSATSQFFFNTTDNSAALDFGGTSSADGYAVFGTVIEGLDVLDRISEEVETDSSGGVALVLEPVIITSVTRE